MATCGRCNGKGCINGFGHIAGGRCFACGGSGQLAAPSSSGTLRREALGRLMMDIKFASDNVGNPVAPVLNALDRIAGELVDLGDPRVTERAIAAVGAWGPDVRRLLARWS